MNRVDFRDESGMTLVELLVATSAGIVVMFGIVAALVVTLHATGRVTSRVEANQRARIAMTKVVNQLHSACVTPRLAPILEGDDTEITFLHQTGVEVQPIPIKSTIYLEDETLKERNYEATGGEVANWTFPESDEPTSTETLATGIGTLSTSTPLFSYFAYADGQVEANRLTTPLEEAAARVVQVDIAFQAAPRNTPVADEVGAPTGLQSSVELRLTPPAQNTDVSDLPCQ